jgi:hypothetical protein
MVPFIAWYRVVEILDKIAKDFKSFPMNWICKNDVKRNGLFHVSSGKMRAECAQSKKNTLFEGVSEVF